MVRILVVAGIIQKNEKILITKRNANCTREPNKWEFPGGKIGSGESPEDALKREITEELGIEIEVGEFFGESTKRYDDGTEVVVSCYLAKPKTNNKIKLIGCQDAKWIGEDKLTDYEFADADKMLVTLFLLKKQNDDES